MVVALHVHDDHVGELQSVVGVGGDQGLLLLDAALDHLRHLRVLGLHRRDAPVQVGDLPEGRAAMGRCMPMTNLSGSPVFRSTESATTPAMTAPTKPTPMTTTISRPFWRCC